MIQNKYLIINKVKYRVHTDTVFFIFTEKI